MIVGDPDERWTTTVFGKEYGFASAVEILNTGVREPISYLIWSGSVHEFRVSVHSLIGLIAAGLTTMLTTLLAGVIWWYRKRIETERVGHGLSPPSHTDES